MEVIQVTLTVFLILLIGNESLHSQVLYLKYLYISGCLQLAAAGGDSVPANLPNLEKFLPILPSILANVVTWFFG